MKILFLDDDPNRGERFLREHGDVVWTKTARSTIDVLFDFDPFDVVYLDHDLGGEVYVDSGREDTGMEVVRWVEANRPAVGRFVVHSLNYPAAAQMVGRLRDAGYEAEYVPFTRLFA